MTPDTLAAPVIFGLRFISILTPFVGCCFVTHTVAKSIYPQLILKSPRQQTAIVSGITLAALMLVKTLSS